MNKILKLTGVSMLAIMTASNANAAGYTCEELIEYTSCNPGYYLSGSGCPDGHTFYSNICYAWGEYHPDMTEEECMDEDEAAYAEYMGAGCTDYNPDDYADDPDMDPGAGTSFVARGLRTCEQCPAGYTCDGGTTQPYVGACEPGYTKHPLCPDGKVYLGVGCFRDSQGIDSGVGKAECEENEDGWSISDWSDIGWCAHHDWFGEYDYATEALVGGTTCGKCPAGYLCSGGDAAAVTCPAGSYCADAGASVATGKCNIGTYSTGGATAATCTSCPVTDLTDKDGKAVVATTSGTGSTSASACFVGDNVEFKDERGIYHYKSECMHGNFPVGTCEPSVEVGAYEYGCLTDGFNLAGDSEDICAIMPTTEAECMALPDDTGEMAWDGENCTCSVWNCDENGQLYCEGM